MKHVFSSRDWPNQILMGADFQHGNAPRVSIATSPRLADSKLGVYSSRQKRGDSADIQPQMITRQVQADSEVAWVA